MLRSYVRYIANAIIIITIIIIFIILLTYARMFTRMCFVST